MRNYRVVLLGTCLLVGHAIGQTVSPVDSKGTPAPSAPVGAASVSSAFSLEDGTPVILRTGRTIASANTEVGDHFDFEVMEEVRVNGVLLIPKGGIAWATVTKAQESGHEEQLDLNLESVRLVDGEKVPLRAVRTLKRRRPEDPAIIATSLVFLPGSPLAVFVHGKDIAKGTEVTAYIDGTTPLEAARFHGQRDPAAIARGAQSASLDIVSNPDGAEIEVDGKPAGNTPATLALTAGEHVIKVTKGGYAPWHCKVDVGDGAMKITADLEQATN